MCERLCLGDIVCRDLERPLQTDRLANDRPRDALAADDELHRLIDDSLRQPPYPRADCLSERQLDTRAVKRPCLPGLPIDVRKLFKSLNSADCTSRNVDVLHRVNQGQRDPFGRRASHGKSGDQGQARPIVLHPASFARGAYFGCGAVRRCGADLALRARGSAHTAALVAVATIRDVSRWPMRCRLACRQRHLGPASFRGVGEHLSQHPRCLSHRQSANLLIESQHGLAKWLELVGRQRRLVEQIEL
jgi:hypothetical protein